MIRGFSNAVSSRNALKRLASSRNERFRSFVSIDNERSSNANDNHPVPSRPQGISMYGYGMMNDNRRQMGNLMILSSIQTRGFRSSSTVSAVSPNDTNLSGVIPTQLSPEEEMAKFEQNATAAVQTSAEVTVAGTENPVWEATWWPQDQMLDFIMFAQEMTGVNYAITIGAITFGFRTLMLPIFIKAQQNSSRMAHVKPEMDVLKAKIDRLDPKDMQKQQDYAKEMQALFRKYDVNPLKSLILPIIQMPVFMSMFFALRKMPDFFQNELSDGGILWFTDLSAPDPYYALPIFSGLSFLAMMELSKKSMLASSPQQGQMMLTVFRGMAFLIVPFSMNFPTCVLTYWTVNNTFSLVQSAAFNNPTIRKQLGIWETPKPVPGAAPTKGMMEMLQDSMKDKRKEGTETNIKQRIEIHNAAVDKKMAGRKKKRRSRK